MSSPEADLCGELLDDLSDLRSQLVDLETLVSAAEDVLKYMPQIPREPGGPLDAATLVALRLHVGRLHSLVVMATRFAGNALMQADMLHARAHEIVYPSQGRGGANDNICLPERVPLPLPAPRMSTRLRKRLAHFPALAEHFGIEPVQVKLPGNTEEPPSTQELPSDTEEPPRTQELPGDAAELPSDAA